MSPRPRLCDCGECGRCRKRDAENRRNAENREMMRERSRAWYAANAEKERQRRVAKRQANLEAARERERARPPAPKVPPYQQRAHSAVKRAIKSGVLVRQSCEVCGIQRVDAHHDDYSKPLEVRWLCHQHHMELHRRVDVAQVAA